MQLYIFTHYDDRGPKDDKDPPKHVSQVNNFLKILKTKSRVDGIN